MSHNLRIAGCPYPIRQTTTEFTWAWRYKPLLEGLAAYKVEYHDPYAPKPLEGKDARNPYLVKKYEEAVAEHEAEFEKIVQWVRAHPEASWDNN